MSDESVFNVYEPKPELCAAVLITRENLQQVADELLRQGYDVTVTRKHYDGDCSLTANLAETETVADGESAVFVRSITAHIWDVLVRRSDGLSAMPYNDFRKEWRRERSEPFKP